MVYKSNTPRIHYTRSRWKLSAMSMLRQEMYSRVTIDKVNAQAANLPIDAMKPRAQPPCCGHSYNAWKRLRERNLCNVQWHSQLGYSTSARTDLAP